MVEIIYWALGIFVVYCLIVGDPDPSKTRNPGEDDNE